MEPFILLVLSSHVILWASAKITNVEIVSTAVAEAVVGGVAKLPCDITPPVTGDNVHLIIWYKESIDLPIYSYDVRGRAVDGGLHWAENTVLGSRAFFRTSDSPAKLTLESVKHSDSGVYRCRIDFKKSPTRNTQVNLTVILPPERLTIQDDKGDHIHGHILGPYNEGSSVDITCISTGGHPVPRVTWWQENALLDDTYDVINEQQVKNVLKLERVERHHLHTVFTCQTSNNNLVTPLSSAVTLDLNLRPISIMLVGENKPLSSGQLYEITCQVVGARPPPIFTWFKDSVKLRNTRELTMVDGNTTVSILTFSPLMEDSGKLLTCKARASSIDNSEIEDSWKLSVFYVPLVTLELGSNLNASIIREGVDVYFECNIRANPWVYRVTWRHNGLPVVNNASSGTIVQNQSLVLQGVSRARAGLYTCVGSNLEGDGESNPVLLDVKFAPVCRAAGGGEQKVVARHELAKVLCELDANPTHVHFTWKFNSSGEMFELPNTHVTSEMTRSIASYIPRTEMEYGTLLCWGANKIGLQIQPCVFHIIPAGKPDPLQNCTIQNQTADSLYVECDEGYDGGLVQEFVMEIYATQSRELITNVTNKSCWFVVTGLPSGVQFDIVMFAVNSKGFSDLTRLTAHTIKSAARRDQMMVTAPNLVQLIPLLGVLTGVVASLIMVASCIILVLRLEGKDCDEKQQRTIMGADMKTSNESIDSLEKNPDIISHANFNDYHEAEPFEKHKSSLYDTSTRIGSNRTVEGITYTEVPPPSSIYSNIGHDQHSINATSEAPLIQHARESTLNTLKRERLFDRKKDASPSSSSCVSATYF